MRHLSLSLFLFLAGCSEADVVDPFSVPDGADAGVADRVALPALELTGPAEAVPGLDVLLTVTGAGPGEPVYFGLSTSTGRGQCLPAAGGLCLALPAPVRLLGVVQADAVGVATLATDLPPGTPLGDAGVQAVVIRGLRGFASAASNAIRIELVSDIFGCTDPAASNYNPAATADDGSCNLAAPTVPGYAGPAGPDLSMQGWTLCSGTASAGTTASAFYTPCAAFSEVRFACSVDANATAEYVSAPVPVAGSAFTDGTCDDWAGGSNSNFGGGKILSIDDTDPGCGQYNVSYDLYMDMVSPQWGCAQVANTHTTGGRMWMYGLGAAPDPVPGCTDPGATNFDPTATEDDGSCTYPAGVVAGFNGVLGPDLSRLGFSQCAGTSSASTTSSQFYALCGGYSEIIFACSTNADATAEYTSPVFSIAGRSLTDAACDDWAGGSNSPFGGGHILSIDDTDPGCGQYNVSYDLYMDMVSPQWGCAQVNNTHTTGGRMWAWVR